MHKTAEVKKPFPPYTALESFQLVHSARERFDKKLCQGALEIFQHCDRERRFDDRTDTQPTQPYASICFVFAFLVCMFLGQERVLDLGARRGLRLHFEGPPSFIVISHAKDQCPSVMALIKA